MWLNLEFDFGLLRSAGRADGADAPGVSIFTALPEQLGLRLEPRREPMSALVIDSVAQLTPN